MPAIELTIQLERSISGKSKVKAYAAAFSVTGFIRRETSTTCFLRMEAARKSQIIDCLGALYNNLENTSFDILMGSLEDGGRRIHKQFTIIESQDWKQKREDLSSDNNTSVLAVARDKCFKNTTLIQSLEEKLMSLSESELDSNTILSSPTPKKLKYTLYEDTQRYYVEVLASQYSSSDISVSLLGCKLTIQTAAISLPFEGKKKIIEGFSYGSNTVTEITLPPNATELEGRSSLNRGILRLTLKKRKVHEQTTKIEEENISFQ